MEAADGMAVSSSVFVIDLENGVAALLLLALDDGYEGGPVEAGGTLSLPSVAW